MTGPGDVSAIFRTLSQAHLVQIGLIVLGAWLLITLSTRLLPLLANRVSGRFRFYLLASVPALRLLVIIGALVLTVTRVIEPTIENLMVSLGAMGLALGFAFKDYVSSLIAGVVTLYEAPYRPGDWIEVNGAYGEVKSIDMRSAEIVTPDDTVVVIPHLKLWDQLIFNANDGGQNLLCVADFYLHPRHDAATGQAHTPRCGPDQRVSADRQPDHRHGSGKTLGNALSPQGLPDRSAPAVSFHHRSDRSRQSRVGGNGCGLCRHARRLAGVCLTARLLKHVMRAGKSITGRLNANESNGVKSAL